MRNNKFISNRISTTGYTMVELVLVIVIIGILGSLVFVGYNSWRQSTVVAVLSSDLSSAASAMENARTFDNKYPELIPSTVKPSRDVTVSGGGSSDGKTYCINAVNSQLPSLTYHIDSSGIKSKAKSGACPVYYGLTAAAVGGGSVSGNGTFLSGVVTQLVATPSEDHWFKNWTGDAGCSGVYATVDITMDANKTCSANFVTNWVPGVAGTTLEGKYVWYTGLSGTYSWGPNADCPTGYSGSAPCEIGLDPDKNTNATLVSPQTYPSIDFSAYPAQNACKGIGGRLPNMHELAAIYANKPTYPKFVNSFYYSATEVNTPSAYGVNSTTGNLNLSNAKSFGSTNVQCVKGEDPPDTTPPSQVTGLAQVLYTDHVHLSWSAASDNRAVIGYDVNRGGSIVHSQGVSVTWDDYSGANGSVYKVRAKDAAGNIGSWSSTITAHDDIGPVWNAWSPMPFPCWSSGQFYWYDDSVFNDLYLCWNTNLGTVFTDNVGVVGYQLKIADTVVYTGPGTTYHFGYYDLYNPVYWFRLRAYDAAGNWSGWTDGISWCWCGG